MEKKMKIWLIMATALVLAGCVIFGGVMTMLNWDFRKLSTNKLKEKEYTISEDYKKIYMAIGTADVLFVPSEHAETTVVCYQQEKMEHSVAVQDDALVIEMHDTRKWYEHIGIQFDTPKITVYLPQGEYGALSIETDTGDVEIPKDFRFTSMVVSTTTGEVTIESSALEQIKISAGTGHVEIRNVEAGSIELSVSTGEITASNVACREDMKIHVSTGEAELRDITCKNVISTGNTGDISLENVIAAETFSIQRTTGDVKLKNADAAQICIETNTGDVRGSLLTDKVFVVHTDTGKVNVPKTTTGGVCEVNTNTGDIKITVSS